MCNEHHTYEKQFPAFGIGRVPTRRLDSCHSFLEKTPTERREFLESIQGCISCLDTKHEIGQCKWSSKNKCGAITEKTECGEPHHILLHEEDDLCAGEDYEDEENAEDDYNEE